MPQYKVKVYHDPTNLKTSAISVEEIHAPNPESVVESFKIMGQHAEIIEILGSTQPDMQVNKPIGIPPSNQNTIIPQQHIPGTPSSQPAIVTFTHNGIQYKVENGIAYKKDWVDVEDEDYRIIVFDGKSKIQKLCWGKI